MRFVIIDKVHPVLFEYLEEEQIQYDYLPEIKLIDLNNIITTYDGLIVRNKVINAELLNNAKSLKFIGRAGAGLDNIDILHANSLGIKVFNASEANRDTVGEHTLGMLLCLLNKILISNIKLKKNIWDREGGRGTELAGKTVGIIGYGNMGAAFAKRLSGFDCDVVFYDKEEKYNDLNFVRSVSLEELCLSVDIVSLHIPLISENVAWFNERLINGIKKPFYLINVARGEVIDTKSLIDGIENGKILGACLDVFENENISQLSETQRHYFEYLVNRENVVFTPHVAGWSVESYEKISKVLFAKIKREILGQDHEF